MSQRGDEYLKAYWSKREKDFVFHWPGRKADGMLLHCWFTQEIGPRTFDGTPQLTIIQELERRGYDLSTLRFSIRKRPEPRDETKEETK